MIPWRRQQFNESWSVEKYERFLSILQAQCGEAPPFQHSETPCFLTNELVDRMSRYGREMVEQLLSNGTYVRESQRAVPERWRVPNQAAAPLFVQADFGLDEHLEPKLVEIQGFPSLYAYQLVLSSAYRAAFRIDSSLCALPRRITEEHYHAQLRRAIVDNHDPANVVLLEVDPWRQKTRHDFRFTEQFYGVRTVDIRAVIRQGSRLFYEHEGKLIPIKRIYNRTIVDELERRHIQCPFDYRADLDVEWAGHPNWFFLLSKFSLPYLDHPAAPHSVFLDRADEIEDPERWVLKPLFSFAGLGVVVGPSRKQLDSVPAAKRADYILQRRVNFRPVIDTPAGLTKMEVRIMYVWLEELQPVNIVVRMGRGAQMGVDHNKNMEWVGASAAFIE